MTRCMDDRRFTVLTTNNRTPTLFLPMQHFPISMFPLIPYALALELGAGSATSTNSPEDQSARRRRRYGTVHGCTLATYQP